MAFPPTVSNVRSSWGRSDLHLALDIDHSVEDRVKLWVRLFEFGNEIVEPGRRPPTFDVLILECHRDPVSCFSEHGFRLTIQRLNALKFLLEVA